MPLADVADVDDASDRRGRPRAPRGARRPSRWRRSASRSPFTTPASKPGQRGAMAPHHLERDRSAQEADRRAHARPFGNDDAAHPELFREPARRAAARRRRTRSSCSGRSPGRARSRARARRWPCSPRRSRTRPPRARAPRARAARPRASRARASAAAASSASAPSANRARIDAAEREVGVGHRGLASAAPVRGRAGIGARAVRPHGDALHPVDARDRAAARADLDHLDHRHAHGQPAALHVPIGARDLERARPLGLTAGR